MAAAVARCGLLRAASRRTVLSVDRFHPIGAEILFPPVGPATTDTIR